MNLRRLFWDDFNKFNNVLDTTKHFRYFIRFAGVCVYVRHFEKGQIVARFSKIGFTFFIAWIVGIMTSIYNTIIEDQSILKQFYSTKLGNYGDDYEKTVFLFFIVYIIWKIPFDLGGCTYFFKLIVSADRVMQNIGVDIDYSPRKKNMLIVIFGQLISVAARFATTYLTIKAISDNLPYDRIFQVVLIDEISLLVTSFYASFISMVQYRYKLMNKVLIDIRDHKLSSLKSEVQTDELFSCYDHYKLVSERIKACSQVYGILYAAVLEINKKFGLVLVMTYYIPVSLLILNTFYLMEASSIGMYEADIDRYVNFAIYIIWGIIYDIGVVILNVFFSVKMFEEAKRTPLIVHQILNTNFNSMVNEEAKQFSLQILHQKPVISPCGLFKMDYEQLLYGASFVTTFIVLLLQFATSK